MNRNEPIVAPNGILRRRGRRLCGGGAGLLLAVMTVARAGADAVPPPPSRCPAGKIPVTSHAGPACVAPAPKNCPPGWEGRIGGNCVVASCKSDADCGAGRQCRGAQVCQHEYLQEWGWGADNWTPAGAVERSLYAEPPRRFDPPRRVVEVVDICRPDASCPQDWKCVAGRVCLPLGVERPGYYPAPTAPKSSAK